MVGQDLLLPCFAADVCVYFRGDDAFMPEHVLDHPQVGAVLNEMCGERMSEGVRGYAFPDIGDKSLLLYHLEHGYTAERLAEPVEEEDVVICILSRFRPESHVFRNGVRSHFSDRDKPFLVTFASDPDEALVEIKA